MKKLLIIFELELKLGVSFGRNSFEVRLPQSLSDVLSNGGRITVLGNNSSDDNQIGSLLQHGLL